MQTLMRICNLRRYNGHIYYIPAPGYEGTGTPFNGELETTTLLKSSEGDSDRIAVKNGYTGPLQTSSSQWRDLEGPFILIWLNNVPWCSTDIHTAPHAKVYWSLSKLFILALFRVYWMVLIALVIISAKF